MNENLHQITQRFVVEIVKKKEEAIKRKIIEYAKENRVEVEVFYMEEEELNKILDIAVMEYQKQKRGY